MKWTTIAFAILLGSVSCVQADWKKHTIVESAGSGIPSAVASDFDGDGNVDVIAAYQGQVIIHRGPDWKPVSVHTFDKGLRAGPAAIHSCLMDCDGDGDLDFVAGAQFAGKWKVYWLETPADPLGSSQWTFRIVDEVIDGVHCVLVADVNQDGVDDLITNSFNGPDKTSIPNSVVWLDRPTNVSADATWTRHVIADKDAPGGSHYMGFGDINGDGRPDVTNGAKGTDGFEGGQWFAWWEQPSDLSKPWTKHLLAMNEVGATNIHPGDFDGDGVTDLFATRGHGEGVLLFRGPELRKEEVDPTILKPHSLVTVDLDGDGDLDAATCTSTDGGHAVWYENDGRGRFTRHDIDAGQGCYDIRAVDLDADGDLDLLLGGQQSRNIVWYENRIRQ